MYLGYSLPPGKGEDVDFDRLRAEIAQMQDGPDKRALERRIAKVDKMDAARKRWREEAARDEFIMPPEPQERTSRQRSARRGAVGLCSYCGAMSDDIESDHIVAKSLSGANGSHNRTPACRPCNQQKGDKPFLIWLMEIGGRHE